MKRHYTIRDTLWLANGILLAVVIAVLSREIYVEWRQWQRIDTLQDARKFSDLLFNATDKLAVERDLAFAMLYSSTMQDSAVLQARLDTSRQETEDAFAAVMALPQLYTFSETVKLREKVNEDLQSIRILRVAVQQTAILPKSKRDPKLPLRWYKEVTDLISDAQDLWNKSIGHFTDIDPVITQHLRYRYLLRVISDYTGRQRAIVGRLIEEQKPPEPGDAEKILRWQGRVDLAWENSRVLAEQSGIYSAVKATFDDARQRYQELYDTAYERVRVSEDRGQALYPLTITQWFDRSDQVGNALTALKTQSRDAIYAYQETLLAGIHRDITLMVGVLAVVSGLGMYCFRLVERRVITPINGIANALLDATQGKPASLPFVADERNDEIAKLTRVLHVLQQNVEDIRRATTQAQSSENRLRAVVDNALNGIISINTRGLIETFNPKCEEIFGYKAQEVIGRNINMLMPEPYHSQHDGYLRHYLDTGDAKIIGTAGREVRAKRKDGSTFPIDLSVSRFQLEDGQHFSGIIRDITDRKKAENELLRYTQALERSNKELDDFAYIASHDLKEPLRGLFNHASFLMEDYGSQLDVEGKRRLERLSYLAQRMERLVNDLLYFSRLGRQDLAVQPTNVNDVIQDIKNTLDVFLEERHAEISTVGKLPVITCDKTRITEVFRNLITNAVKYNDQTVKRVEIGFLPSHMLPDGSKRNDVFYVKDNGRGIAPEFYEEIFRIFKRLQNTSDTREEGTGVGLTFVKKIIERHGGKIWLQSEPGKGTTFYFTLDTAQPLLAAA